MTDREVVLRGLRRRRPRSRFLRASVGLLALLGLYSWLAGGFSPAAFFGGREAENVARFVSELRPHPLQGRDWDWGVAWSWAGERMAEHGWRAAGATLAISVAAIVLAALGAAALCLLAARNFATPEPFLPGPRPPRPLRAAFWALISGATRLFLIFLRSIPEFVWAFLLLVLFGPTAWPAVLALAIHNCGIIGKLTAEVVENAERRAPAALRGLGATRRQIAAAGIFPAVLPRFLLFFFYRWETCVREATILGLLGIVSLGYWIQDARARMHHDAMFLYVLVGAALVILGDVASALARRWVRRA